MRSGRPKRDLVLGADELSKLTSLSRRPSTPQQIATRARIVLCSAEGMPNTAIAQELGVTEATVCKWRERFRTLRLDGLNDNPRPGAPRKINEAMAEEVVVRTLEPLDSNAGHWTTRMLAKATGLSQSAVVRIWRNFGLRTPGKGVVRVGDLPALGGHSEVAGLYMDPPDYAIVFDTNPRPSPTESHNSAAFMEDANRQRATRLVEALRTSFKEAATAPDRGQRHQELLLFLDRMAEELGAGTCARLIMDDDLLSKRRTVQRWVKAHPAFDVHCTGKNDFWFNVVTRLLVDMLFSQEIPHGIIALEHALVYDFDQGRPGTIPFAWTVKSGRLL